MPALGQSMDLTGHKYGMLTVIKRAQKSDGYMSMWQCLCDCGNTKEVRINHLRGRKTISCGCMSSRNCPGAKSGKWSGCGEVTGSLFSQLRTAAIKRKLEVAVTVEDLWNLFEKQERKCAMTGLGLTLRGYGKPPGTASVDRIDSSKGYTKDNIQWVHKDVNKMKMDFTKEYFIEVCRLITEKH